MAIWSLGEIIAEFGKACGMPGSFQGSIAVLLTHNEYVSAVRANILGGGDCCSRDNFFFCPSYFVQSQLTSYNITKCIESRAGLTYSLEGT